MNKFAKILSVVLSVTMVVGISVSMLVSAFAASDVTFSVSKVSETDTEVVVSVNLESGKFNAVDFTLSTSDKITSCTKATASDALKDFRSELEENGGMCVYTASASTMKFGGSMTTAFSASSTKSIYTFTLAKKAGAGTITANDVKLTIDDCSIINSDNQTVDVSTSVLNKLPAATTTTTTTTTKKTTTTTTTTKKATTTTTTKKATTTTTKADGKPVAPVEDVDTNSGSTTVADVVDSVGSDTTTVTNPNTGDSVSATLAIVSLLAVSGAAVVALRKKEN